MKAISPSAAAAAVNLLLCAAAAITTTYAQFQEQSFSSVAVILATDKDLSTFYSLVQLGGFLPVIDGTSSGTDGITVFAPTNAAFASLPEDILTNLQDAAWTAHLTNVLGKHVLAGEVLSTDIIGVMQVTALSGETVLFYLDPNTGITVDGVNILVADVVAENGDVVHIIDGVLQPAWFNQTLLEAAELVEWTRNSAFAALVDLAGLTEFFASPGPFTVFAPLDDAFAALDSTVVSCLTGNSEWLSAMLLYHVLASGTLLSYIDITTGIFPTVEGSNLALDVTQRTVGGSATVDYYDGLLASNGIVHVIDTVLLPPSIAADVAACALSPPSPTPLPTQEPMDTTTKRCSSTDQVGMTLKSWYFGHENGGLGLWSECENLCREDPKCNSWMGRNSGNACYLSEDLELKPKPEGCCEDHHPHTFNVENCGVPDRCSSTDQVGMTLKSWYFGHENGGSGLWFECENLCREDPKCNSWMGRNSGNACYLSEDPELKPKPDGCCEDHHPHTFNVENCVGSTTETPTTTAPVSPTTPNPMLAPVGSPPTESPTVQKETGTEKRARIFGITIEFVGVDELTPQEIAVFEEFTEDWYEAYYRGLESGSSPDSVQARALTTTVQVANQTVRTAGKTINTIKYDQTLVYVALDDSLNTRDYVLRPFLDNSAKGDYATRLQTIDAFRNVEIPIPTPRIPTASEVDRQADRQDAGGGGLSTSALAGVVAGSLALVAIGVGGWVLCGRRKQQRQGNQTGNNNDDGRPVIAPTLPNDTTVVAEPVLDFATQRTLPTFKDQSQNVGGSDEPQPVPFAAVMPVKEDDDGGAGLLPQYKDQTGSVNRGPRNQPPPPNPLPHPVPLRADEVDVVNRGVVLSDTALPSSLTE